MKKKHGQTMIYKTRHRKLKIEQHEPDKQPEVTSGAVSAPLIAPTVLLSLQAR